ncbi:MAG: ArsR family transcriptional regulator [Spirochaetales bacterium]|nr:ArsR family transcriptional regulator [Spirochaetales bacterium]
MNTVRLFKALSDETRLRITALLLEHELHVSEITEVLEMGQSRISRHLKILTDAGLISFRRDGLWSFYHASRQGDGFTFINQVKYLFKDNPVFKQDGDRINVLKKTQKKEIRRFFNTIAGDWERLKADILKGFDLAGVIDSVLPRCSVVADLGCGTGDLLPLLHKKAIHVIGVDNSPRMLEKARVSLEKKPQSYDLRIGELEHLPLKDNEAETVIINMVLHHLSEPGLGINEAFRVVKTGGMLIIADFEKHADERLRSRYGDRWLGFENGQVLSWLKETGFTIKERTLHQLENMLSIFLITALKQ